MIIMIAKYIKNMTKGLVGCCVVAALTPVLASCDKLDEVPDNRTEIDNAEKVALLLTSGYPKSTPAVICELSGDNLVDNNVVVPATHNSAYSAWHEEAYQWKDIVNYSTGEDDTPYAVWEANYEGIAVANHAIEAMEKMIPTALELLKDPEEISLLEENAGKLALPDAARKIADEVYKLV